MSQYSNPYLQNNVLVGMTDVRGNAWWANKRSEDDKGRTNHYPQFIPVADVKSRLFAWHAVSLPVGILVPADVTTPGAFIGADGNMVAWKTVEGQQHIARDDTYARMGTFSTGYTPHQYDEWLIGVTSNILGDTIGITSAGLLKDGAVAWVEIGVPENVTTPEGVVFRPNLLAGTSFDGSIATFFKRTATATVCDNTFAAARSEVGQAYKVKHTRYSGLKIDDARQALHLTREDAEQAIDTMRDEFAAEVKALCETTVTDRQWFAFLDTIAPTDGKDMSGRAKTIAVNKQHELRMLWAKDERVSPWAGTAFGVLQAMNTYETHIQTVRGAHRAERNMLSVIKGDQAKSDDATLVILNKILTNV